MGQFSNRDSFRILRVFGAFCGSLQASCACFTAVKTSLEHCLGLQNTHKTLGSSKKAVKIYLTASFLAPMPFPGSYQYLRPFCTSLRACSTSCKASKPSLKHFSGLQNIHKAPGSSKKAVKIYLTASFLAPRPFPGSCQYLRPFCSSLRACSASCRAFKTSS